MRKKNSVKVAYMWEVAVIALDVVLAILPLIAVIMVFKEKEPVRVLLKTCGAEVLLVVLFVFRIMGVNSQSGEMINYFETLVIHFFETLVIQILLTIRMIALKSKEKPVIKIIGLVLTIGGLLFLLL